MDRELEMFMCLDEQGYSVDFLGSSHINLHDVLFVRKIIQIEDSYYTRNQSEAKA